MKEVYEMQSALFDSFVDAKAQYLTVDQFQTVIEERCASDLCGYPICPKKKSGLKGKYKISRDLKLLPMDQLYFFCSRECLACYKYLISQMSIEPVYVRTRVPQIELLQFHSPAEKESQDSLIEHFRNQSLRDQPVNDNSLRDESCRDVGLDESIKALTIKERKVEINRPQSSLVPANSQSGNSVKERSSSTKKNINKEKLGKGQFQRENVNLKESDDDSMQDSINSQATLSDSSEEEEWLVPSKKKLNLKLSCFARIWMYLDRLITENSKMMVKEDDSIDFKMSSDSGNVTRLNLFSKSILVSYNNIKKSFNISLRLEDDLLNLLKSFDYARFSSVSSNQENWILTSVFLRALSFKSDRIFQDFNGKWEKIVQKTGLSMDQFNALCKAFD